jgi:hypothetical protein
VVVGERPAELAPQRSVVVHDQHRRLLLFGLFGHRHLTIGGLRTAGRGFSRLGALNPQTGRSILVKSGKLEGGQL